MSALATEERAASVALILEMTERSWIARSPQLEGHIALRFRSIPEQGLYHVRGNDALVRIDISPLTFAHPRWHDILDSCYRSAIRVRRGLNMASDMRRV